MLQQQAARWLTVRRIMVIGGAAVFGALLSLAYFLLLRGNYQASAVLKFEAGMAEYRRLLSVALSESGFRGWASQQENVSPELLTSFVRLVSDAGRIQGSIAPFYRVTRRDVRDIANPTKDDPTSTPLMGVQLQFVARSPEQAAALTKLAAHYLRDTALWDAANDYVRRYQREYPVRVQRLEAELLRKSFEVSQLNAKLDELRRLNARYPQSNRLAEQQVLSVGRESNHLFLAPLAQLVGTEAQLVDLRRTMTRLQRELEQARVAATFFDGALERIGSLKTGVTLLQELESLHGQVARSFKADQSEAVREILNEIAQSLTAMRISFVSQPPFLTADQVVVVRTISPFRAGTIGLVIGALSCIAALTAPMLIAWLRQTPPDARAG